MLEIKENVNTPICCAKVIEDGASAVYTDEKVLIQINYFKAN